LNLLFWETATATPSIYIVEKALRGQAKRDTRTEFFMQFAILCCICILILFFTGALDAACERMHVAPIGAAFTALSVIALSRFLFKPCPEIIINAATGFLPAYLLLGGILRHERVVEKSSLLLLLTSIAYSVALIFLADADKALLLCLGAALVAAFLRESPLLAMFTASLVPLIGPVFYACYELYATGYASCDLNAAYVLDAQMVGLISTTLACYFFGARSPQPENG
jgi:hypothetical protein